MIHLLFAAALLQSPDPCNAATGTPPPRCPQWEFVRGGGNDPVAVDMYINRASLHFDRATAQVDVRTVYHDEQPDHVRSVIESFRIDCVQWMTTLLLIRRYATDGSLLDESEPTGSDAAPHSWAPDRLGFRVVSRVCLGPGF